jgi:acetyl-CoA carboxylase biotin carboxyl carrier protein
MHDDDTAPADDAATPPDTGPDASADVPADTGAAGGPDADREPPGTSRIDLGVVRRLIELMNEADLAELEVEQEDVAVRLRKAGAAGAPLVAGSAAPPPSLPAATAGAAPAPAGPAAPAEGAPEAEELPAITSPMVGTFYTAPSPDADDFVQVGDHVDEETVVCVIEAMKVFNEIKAELRGTIERVCVPNAEVVEFGQPLFTVRPD